MGELAERLRARGLTPAAVSGTGDPLADAARKVAGVAKKIPGSLMSGAEAFLTVFDALTPQPYIYGALSPETTVEENLKTPAFSRKYAADVMRERGWHIPDPIETSRLSAKPGLTSAQRDMAKKLEADNPAPGAMDAIAALSADLLTGVSPIKIAPLTAAGKLAQTEGRLVGKGLATQGREGLRSLVGVAPPVLGLNEKVLAIPTSTAVNEKVLGAAGAAGRALGRNPMTKALGKIGSEARYAKDAGVAELGEETGATLDRANRGMNAAVQRLGTEADAILAEHPNLNAEDVHRYMHRLPVQKAVAEAEKLDASARVLLDRASQEYITGLKRGGGLANAPAELKQAAQVYRDKADKLRKAYRDARASVHAEMISMGIDPAEVERRAKESVSNVADAISTGEGATPIITGQKSSSPTTAKAQGVVDFEPDRFATEAADLESALAVGRRINARARAASPTTTPFRTLSKEVDAARQALDDAATKHLQELQVAGLLEGPDAPASARYVLRAQTLRQKGLAATKRGQAELAALEAKLTQNDKAGAAKLRAMLDNREAALKQRNILGDVRQEIQGNYFPVVARSEPDEAADALKKIAEARRADPSLGADEAAKSLGYNDYQHVLSVSKNPAMPVLNTSLGEAKTPHTQMRHTDPEIAVTSPQHYMDTVGAAMVGAARSERAIRSYDLLQNIHDLAEQRGLVRRVSPTDANALADVLDPLKNDGVEFARLGSGSQRAGFDKFEAAFGKTRGFETGTQIYVPKEIASMIDAYMNPERIGWGLRALQEAQGKITPLYTAWRIGFNTSNKLSGSLFNLMHLSPAGTAAVAYNYPKLAWLGKTLTSEGHAALTNPANKALFAKTVNTANGPVTLGQLAAEMLDNNVVGQGISGQEFVENVDSLLRAKKGKPGAAKRLVTAYPRGAEKFANFVENMNRIEGYAGQRMMGAPPGRAADESLKWHVDYSRPLTTANKRIRALSPFYRWYQAQVPNMIGAMLGSPNRVRAMVAAPLSWERSTNSPEDVAFYRKNQPEYSRDRGDVLFNADAVNLYSANPRQPGPTELGSLNALTKAFTAPEGDALAEFAKHASREAMNRLGPIPSTAAALGFGYDTFRERPIEEYEYVPPAMVDLVLGDTPIGHALAPFIKERRGRLMMNGKLLYALNALPPAMWTVETLDALLTGRSGLGRAGLPSKQMTGGQVVSGAVKTATGLRVKPIPRADFQEAARRAEFNKAMRERRAPRPLPPRGQ